MLINTPLSLWSEFPPHFSVRVLSALFLILVSIRAQVKTESPMGARLSLSNNHKASCTELFETSHSKRQRTSPTFWDENENPRLIPALPDEISIQILARLPRISHFKAKLVSRTWKAALMSEELYKLRKELGTTEEWLYILTKQGGENLIWYALDPVSRQWPRLPLMPKNIAVEDEVSRRGLSSFISDTVRGWFARKYDPLDEILLCGCAIAAVDGCLYLLGGFCNASAMNSVWRYDPIANSWSEATPMSVGRAYCKTAVLNNKLYVVGGVTRPHGGGLTPLQSGEVFDPSTGLWTDLPSMPFSKTQVLPTAFLADLLKPIATGMASYRGKLYVPQSLYCWPFFVDVGGEFFDPDTDSWGEMPVGMGEGWPAKQAGTKLSVVVDGELYALDPSRNLESGSIKVYDQEDDAWNTIEGDVPIRDMTDSESPYLLASFLGKLHVITKDVNSNLLVMQADRRNQLDSAASQFQSIVRERFRRRGLSPSTSYASLGEDGAENVSALNGSIWKVIATGRAGAAELVSCQILDI